jgi:type IX secretion system PorP/SprF family membrane protein
MNLDLASYCTLIRNKILPGICLLPLLMLLPHYAQAQQDPLYAQYLNNPLLINPAYTGSNKSWVTNVGYRRQWAGFDGSPTTLNFSSHISLVDNKVGAGLMVIQDNIGETKNTEITANYSYRIEQGDKSFLFGLSTGVMRYQVDPGQLRLQNPSDPAFGFTNETQFNTGVGMMMKSERYMVGLSVPKLIPGRVSATGGQEIEIYNRHVYLFAGYIMNINERFKFKPTTLIKGTAGAPASIDLNANLVIDQSYTVGLLTRNFNTYGLTLQAWLKEFRLGYVFEVPTNQSVGQRFTSHDIALTYTLPFMAHHDRTRFSNF